MNDQAPSDLAWVPDACTLPTPERPLRAAEFDALFARAVAAPERLAAGHLRITLSGNADLEDQVRALAARETACCSFFSFTVVAPEPGRVRLDVEVPAGRVEMLDALARRASTARGES